MEDNLLNILESFNFPVFRQGSLLEGTAYPETFITFWERPAEDVAFYDNNNNGVFYLYDVNIYATSPNLCYSLLRQIIAALKSADWIIVDRGHDIASDEVTHRGRGAEVGFLKYNDFD